MRTLLIEQIKAEIETKLRQFLREEGIELHLPANDNSPPCGIPLVELESLSDLPLLDNRLLSEIRVILGILGRPWQSDALVQGIYHALHPHHVTHRELTVLLMSLQVESLHCLRPRCIKKRVVIRYIVEEPEHANENSPSRMQKADAGCC